MLYSEENQSVIFKVQIFNFIFEHIKGKGMLNFRFENAPAFYCLIKKETFIGVNLDGGGLIKVIRSHCSREKFPQISLQKFGCDRAQFSTNNFPV